MNRVLSIFVTASFLLTFSHVGLTQATSADPRALSLMQRSLSALGGGRPVADITLMGTARRVAGSDDETGGVIAKALVTGESRIDFNFPSGQRSEMRSKTQRGPAGKWSGPDGVQHTTLAHNLLVDDSAWFAPLVGIQRHANASGINISYVGRENLQGHTVEHLIVSHQFPPSPLPAQVMATVRKAAQMSVYLDATTLVPLQLSYLAHAENDIQADFPVEVHFSDYRVINGWQVPFHVEKVFRGTVILDLQFQTATVNSGLSAASLNLQ